MDKPDVSAGGSRRSNRLAAGTATASWEKLLGATKKNSTSNSLGLKATPKSTFKNSKSNAPKPGDTKKTTKMDVDVEEDEEGLKLPQKEARTPYLHLWRK